MREEEQGRSLPKRTTRPVVRTIPAALCRKKKPLKLEIVFWVVEGEGLSVAGLAKGPVLGP